MVHPPACAGAERRHLSRRGRGARPRRARRARRGRGQRPAGRRYNVSRARKICPRDAPRLLSHPRSAGGHPCPLLARLLVFACLRHFPPSPRAARHPHPLLITRSPLPDIECIYFSNNDFIARHTAEESERALLCPKYPSALALLCAAMLWYRRSLRCDTVGDTTISS
eukprot:COSAG06_NODE_449_length_15623_cov_50.097204_8_plen_168_part_00